MNTTYNQSRVQNAWSIWSVIALIICIAIPLIVGAISAFLTKDAMVTFNAMNKPPLAPPSWLFPIAWTIIYVLMGIASFLIYQSSSEEKYMGQIIYIVQLIFNFAWSIIFFNLGAYGFSCVWLAILLIMVIALIMNTAQYSIPAMVMLIPYAVWCCFAMYLNIGVAIMN
ncbi:MAG: tryptophan-rich sensory protein [Lachnospiraceae bacterium]|nr:tryptophan-rich sensory protein [Candidatus Colinaster equi]